MIVDLLGLAAQRVPPGPDRHQHARAQAAAPAISADHLFGVEPQNGRDIFSRVVYGARISLLIAFLATLLSVVIGSTLGVVAGYFGGWVDALISRAMDVFLAFPLLVFAIALAGVMPDTAFGLSGDALRIALLIFIIGFFSWPYIGRIVRGQTLSLREREFVDAARSLGARGPYIIFKEMLPNLVAPILIYATLLIPTNILFEAALSFLGVGIRPPTASWGGMLSEAARVLHDLALHVLPGHGHLHHRAGLQPLRRRPARRARPQGPALTCARMTFTPAVRSGPGPFHQGGCFK